MADRRANRMNWTAQQLSGRPSSRHVLLADTHFDVGPLPFELPQQPHMELTPDEPLETVRRKIVHTAIALAERAGSWDAVHVHVVAREAGISLEELQRHFQDKDAIAEGWFDTADASLLSAANQAGWRELEARERLYRVMMAWLDALAPHRRLALAMLRYKFHPEHLHLQARGIMRISRTVQWIREVAMLPAVGWRREGEEATLTSIYLAAFACWLTDNSAGTQRTRRFLKSLLATAERGPIRWIGRAA
jgi:ubiquinone biosynthesis protein COQ9